MTRPSASSPRGLRYLLTLPLRLLNLLFNVFLAMLILFEEWGWEPLQKCMQWLGSFPALRWIENRVRALPPYGALAIFLVPTLMLLPVKLMALGLISQGRVLMGTLVIIAAKLGGTATVAWLFTLTQPVLMQLAWFVRLYTRWTLWKLNLLTQVRSSWPWRAGRVLKARWKKRWALWKAQQP